MSFDASIHINITECVSKKVGGEQLDGVNMQSDNGTLPFLDILQNVYAKSKCEIETREAIERGAVELMAVVVMNDMQASLLKEAREVAKVKANNGMLSVYYDRESFIDFIKRCQVDYNGEEYQIPDVEKLCNRLLDCVYKSAEKIGIECNCVRRGCYCFRACIKP